MAAKPPKPPGSFLKSLLNQHNNNIRSQSPQRQQQHNNETDDVKEDGNSSKQNLTATTSTTTIERIDKNTTTTATASIKKGNCNCSNISIMHLFHEMKQEFPTIPDTIVAQCVNANCHQRENCTQMLKNELELNPIPAQSYPAKVLHPPNNNTNNNNNLHNSTNINGTSTFTEKPVLQQKPLVVAQQKPPLKPLKPIRTAPLQPPSLNQQPRYVNNSCTEINLTSTNKNTPITTTTTTTKPLGGEDFAKNDTVDDNGAGGLVESNGRPTKQIPQHKQSIFTTAANNINSTSLEVCNDDKVYGGESTERNLPRQRPTTLNLNSTQLQRQQQQQRQRLNIQLQQRFQEQRNRQSQQPPKSTTIVKPLRKAPLPPIAPKPSQFHLNPLNANIVNSFLNDSLLAHHTTTSPPSESEISVSVSISTPSPTSSSSSPNTTTHNNPFNKPTHTQTSTTNQQHLQTKSPIRHRSVITLQPEPPNARDFLFTPTSLTYASSAPPTPTSITKQTNTTNYCNSSATSSPTTSVAGSQKSFTSVNLTLRPPLSPSDPNSALQPSTIDITAGPGFSGASGGGKSLHYSSTSYDARLGYQQNFQITVTDECGIFSASRTRPQQLQQQRCLNQQQFHNNNVVALQQNIQNSINTSSSDINESGVSGGGSGGITENTSGDMCLPPQQATDNVPTEEVLQRQKKKRDKLAAALREYKKRLGNVEQEINLLTGTISTEGLSERLDEEIIKLRRDCQDMLRSSNGFTQQPIQQQELTINHQPQPFPRQRITHPPPRPPPPRQTSLDIIQHHSQTSTPHTPPAASLPNLNSYNPQQYTDTNFPLTTPLYYHQQSEPVNFGNNNILYTDHHNSSYMDERDLTVDDGDDYDVIEPWECNMCTFRNHPQLNICETCENVRIIPGRLTHLSQALSATNITNTAATRTASATTSNNLGLLGGAVSNKAINNGSSANDLNTANGNLEHDTNFVQQQLQHFALHT